MTETENIVPWRVGGKYLSLHMDDPKVHTFKLLLHAFLELRSSCIWPQSILKDEIVNQNINL